MRNVLYPLAFIAATTAVACSFQMQAGDPKNPNNQAANSAQPANTSTGGAATTPAAKPTSNPATAGRTLGRRKVPQPTPTSTSTAAPTAAPTGTTTPPGVAVVNGPTPFGSGTPSATGWKGTISWIPAGATKLPAMAQQQAAGYVFINELNIGVRPFTEGFPGVDANRKENFAIRYEAPLVVQTEGDYEFKLAADDGAVFSIDDTVIVDNDGKHDFKDVTGPVHLVTGTHVMRVDYFQTTGNIGLQLFCKKMGESTDKVCGTSL